MSHCSRYQLEICYYQGAFNCWREPYIHGLGSQVKSGSIFDNIIVTDDFKEAEELANETWGKTKIQEKAVFTKVCARGSTCYIAGGNARMSLLL